MTKTEFTDPLYGISRLVDSTPLTFSWVKGISIKYKVRASVLCSIIQHESDWKPFSDYGPIINISPKICQKLLGDTSVLKLPTKSTSLDYFEREQHFRWRALLAMYNQLQPKYGTNTTIDALLKCMAMGVGQVMLGNFAAAGFTSAISMYNAMWSSKLQIKAMAKFCSQPKIKTAFSLRDYEFIAVYYAGAKWKDYYPDFVSFIELKEPKYAKRLAKVTADKLAIEPAVPEKVTLGSAFALSQSIFTDVTNLGLNLTKQNLREVLPFGKTSSKYSYDL